MKKILLIVFLISTLVIIGQTTQRKPLKQKGVTAASFLPQGESAGSLYNHEKTPIKCKTCHSCEYPTKDDPCLGACPRKGMVSVFHSPEEGPSDVVIGELSNRYTKVVFNHRSHAQMSMMAEGCTGCHHYNTTGPVLGCQKCHSKARSRDNLARPDLEGAIHRQCMTCHRQWSHSTSCGNVCHFIKTPENDLKQDQYQKSIIGKSHPPIVPPEKVIFETGNKAGKFVSFYHNMHAQSYNFNCVQCHRNENCITCHDKDRTITNNVRTIFSFNSVKSFDERHSRCTPCHKTDNCAQCHSSDRREQFDHAKRTGFELRPYHKVLSCDQCHKNRVFSRLDRNCTTCHGEFKAGSFPGHGKLTNFPLKWYHAEVQCGKCHTSVPFAKPSMVCTNCHKNFEKGKFDHKKAGVELDELHIDFDCKECHLNRNFSKMPQCAPCHDDKKAGVDWPGTRLKK